MLTASETLTVLEALEPGIARRARRDGRSLLTARQLRYLDQIGCLRPVRENGSHHGAKLYQPEDVALLRVLLRAIDRGHSPWRVWAAFAYLGQALRAQLRKPGAALVFRGVNALVLPIGQTGTDDADNVFVLRESWAGVESAMKAVRREQSDVCVGWRRVSLQEAALLSA